MQPRAVGRGAAALCLLFLVLLVGSCQFAVPSLPRGADDLSFVPAVGSVSDDLAPADDLGSEPDFAFVAQLTGSWADPPDHANLTAEGELDWAHWGLTGNTDFDHRAGADLISNYTLLGDSTNGPHQYLDNHVAFSWSGGVPHASASNTTSGIWVSGIGNGVQLSAPSGQLTRKLQLYISAHQAAGMLVASLSDGSSGDFSDSFSDQGSGTYRRYTFLYGSKSGRLVITWTQTQSFVSDTSANITLQAVTLAR